MDSGWWNYTISLTNLQYSLHCLNVTEEKVILFNIFLAQEEYLLRTNEALEGLNKSPIFADDVIIYGCSMCLESVEKCRDTKFRKQLDGFLERNVKMADVILIS